MLRLLVQLVAAQLLPQLKASTYSGILRINRLVCIGGCVSAARSVSNR